MLIALAAVLGLVGGSFATVLATRVPAGVGIGLSRSACPECGHTIRWHDNVPVLSWIALRRRCRDCSGEIPWRYPAMELASAGVCVALAWSLGPRWILVPILVVAVVGVALTVIDIDVHRLPNAIVLPLYPVALPLVVATAWLDSDGSALVRALFAMAASVAFYLLLALIKPGGMGMGDVKLSGVLGLVLGYLSWGAVIVGTMAAFILGAIVGVVLMAVGRAGRQTAIPFGPFMLVGALIGAMVGELAWDAYTGSW
jgi:leader peptidase (prepilin peptidase) / N-methyltransferase